MALVFLTFSVWPADFRRVADEVDLTAFAESVRRQKLKESPSIAEDDNAGQATLQAVKTTLVEQYAIATRTNRRKNERRVKWRTLAGLATLASVLSILALVALVVVSTLYGK